MNGFVRLPRSVLIGLGVIAIFLAAIPVAYLLIANTGTASANTPELREKSHEFVSDHKADLKRHLRPSQLETLSSGSGCICEVLNMIRNSDKAYTDECQDDARRLYRQLCSDEQNQCDGADKDRDRDKDRDKKKDKPRQRAEATPTDEPEDRDKDKDRKRRRRRPRATDEWPTPWAPTATPENIHDPCIAFPGICDTPSPEPTNTRRPTRTPYPTDTEEGPAPTNTRRPTRTPYPTDTETPEPTNTRRPTRTPYPTDTDEPEPTARPSRTPTDEPVACHAVKHDYAMPERKCRRIHFSNPLIIDIENHNLPLPGDRPPFDENSVIAMDGYDGYMHGEGAVWEYVGEGCDYDYVKGQQEAHIERRNKDSDFMPKVIGAISLSRAERLEILTEECDGRDDPEPTNTRRPTRTPYPTDTDEPEPTARPTRTPRPTATEDGGGGYPPPRSCESISPDGGETIKAADGLDIPATQWVQVEFWFTPGDGTEWTRLEAGPLDTGALDSKGRIKIWRYLKADCTRVQIEEEHIKPHHELRREADKKPVWADDPTWRRLLRQ